MTVSELIKTLQKCNAEANVVGEWEGITPEIYAITRETGRVVLHVDQMYSSDYFNDRDLVV